jgi:hypothetical protein
MGEQDVSIDEKLFMAYLQILWNQLTVSKFINLDFFSFLILRKYHFQQPDCPCTIFQLVLARNT